MDYPLLRLVLVLTALAPAGIATAEPAPAEPHPLVLELTLADVPRQLDLDGRFPTPREADDLALDPMLALHWSLHRVTRGLGWARVPVELVGSSGLALLFMSGLPATVGWAHEEGHRAVLAEFGIASNDELNHPGESTGTMKTVKRVNGVTDAELAALKASHPADFVRLQSVGLETQVHVVRELEKRVYFAHEPTYTYAPYLLWVDFNTVGYMYKCTQVKLGDLADEQNLSELQRDFTGPDCTAWAYDLDHPTQPYADRGLYPDGTVRRARAFSDLSPRAQRFLRANTALSLLDFVDPMAFGLGGIDVSWLRGAHVTARLEHQLTSFGAQISADVLARKGAVDAFVALHANLNDTTLLPGATVQLVRYPFAWRGRTFWLSPKVDLWLQPKDQRFDTASARPGVLAELTAATRIAGPVEAMVGVDAKTAGWVSGVIELGPAADAWVGVNLLLP